MTTRTMLIGLDAGTFTTLDPMMANGVMPFLRKLVDRGARGTLRSVIPALTPPAWTSLATGKQPGQHGVFDFFCKEAPGSPYFRFAGSRDIGTNTIWDLISQENGRVIALNFPLMFPPPAVNGCIVPGGWMPWRQLRLGCYPPGLFDRLKTLATFNPRELALDMTLEEKTIEGCAAEEYSDWISLHTRRERRWLDILRFVLAEQPANVTAVVFDGVDKLQHLCWRFIDRQCQSENPSPWEQEARDLCESYFRQLDEIISECVALAGPKALVMLVSDHGAGPTHDVFYVNTWLEQRGYLVWASNTAVQSDGHPQFGLGQIGRHVFQLDWERTIAYAATPSSNGIHIVVRSPSSDHGVPPENYVQVRAELAAALREIRHPITGQPVVSEVWTREEAFSGPYQDLAPDLTLTLSDGGIVSIVRADTAIRRRAEVAGAHRAEGIFVASGPGIRAGVQLQELSIVDVAPTLLHSLGLPVPEDMTGQIRLDIFEQGSRWRLPMQSTGRRTVPRRAEPAVATSAYDAEAETIMLRRLQALGYIE